MTIFERPLGAVPAIPSKEKPVVPIEKPRPAEVPVTYSDERVKACANEISRLFTNGSISWSDIIFPESLANGSDTSQLFDYFNNINNFIKFVPETLYETVKRYGFDNVVFVIATEFINRLKKDMEESGYVLTKEEQRVILDTYVFDRVRSKVLDGIGNLANKNLGKTKLEIGIASNPEKINRIDEKRQELTKFFEGFLYKPIEVDTDNLSIVFTNKDVLVNELLKEINKIGKDIKVRTLDNLKLENKIESLWFYLVKSDLEIELRDSEREKKLLEIRRSFLVAQKKEIEKGLNFLQEIFGDGEDSLIPFKFEGKTIKNKNDLQAVLLEKNFSSLESVFTFIWQVIKSKRETVLDKKDYAQMESDEKIVAQAREFIHGTGVIKGVEEFVRMIKTL